MGFLDRALRNGVSNALGTVIEDKILKAVAPDARGNIARTGAELSAAASQLQAKGTAFATELSKNFKLCPSCEEPNPKESKFCQKCGAALPEETLADAYLCPQCGQQNTVGVSYCANCGTKLRGAALNEQRDTHCAGCGAELAEEARFCAQCGTPREG